jgi:hypothetical protein
MDKAQNPITLEFPITTAAGAKVTAVTMRRAKVKDLRRMSDFGNSDAAQEIGLMAHLSGMIPEDFDELDAVDFRKLQETFRRLLGLVAEGNVARDGAAGPVVPVSAG